MTNKYTHYNNDLNLDHLFEKVYLKGWIANKRNLGKIIFLDLRDISGIVQLVVKPDCKQYQQISVIKIETVVEVRGVVVKYVSKNIDLVDHKNVEVLVSEISILSESQSLPFSISSNLIDSLEDIRLKYRYLDLRRLEMKSYLIKRHDITQSIRKILLKNNFLELETPLLSKSTPEGARDYVIPSRLYPKHFYALPQSPQIFKQLYMIAGFERYFQIARCFRDEDLRSDRQPEFTQIDIETSFMSQKDIMSLLEEIMLDLFQKFFSKKISVPFTKLSYSDSINFYGTDKPDLRFELKIKNLTSYFQNSFVENNLNNNKIIGIKLLKKDLNSQMIDKYTKVLQIKYNLSLTTLIKENNVVKGFLSSYIKDSSFLKTDEIFLLLFDQFQTQSYIHYACGFLRNQLAKELNLIDYNKDSLVWIVDFPLFEFDVKNQKYSALHHPFTAPHDVEVFKKNYTKAFAQAYDLVWNGYEIGGGSIRINDHHIQKLMFQILGLNDQDIKKKFGFFLESLKYGTPPHGGIALGLDRLSMLFNRTENIRDVIAFPKNQSAKDLMLETPHKIDKEQLKILNLNYF